MKKSTIEEIPTGHIFMLYVVVSLHNYKSKYILFLKKENVFISRDICSIESKRLSQLRTFIIVEKSYENTPNDFKTSKNDELSHSIYQLTEEEQNSVIMDII